MKVQKALGMLAALSAMLLAENTVWKASRLESSRVEVVKGGGYFPVLVKLDNGEIGAAVRGGATHVGPAGRLDWVRSNDGGRTWTRSLLADAEMDDRNPAVGQLRDGTLVVSYTIDRSYQPDGKRVLPLKRDSIWTVRSKDRGRTWEKPVKSPVALEHGASPYGKMVLLADGTLLMNVYHERGPKLEHETSLVYRSRDGGLTWGDATVIADHYNETSLTLLPDGRLLAVARAHAGQFLSVCVSADRGRTWSAPKRVTADNEHPADTIVLRDGRLLLVHGERNRPYGVRALFSRNLGESWGPETVILAADSHNTDTGYPSSVEIEPGKIVTLYYGVDGDTGKLDGAFARAIIWEAPR